MCRVIFNQTEWEERIAVARVMHSTFKAFIKQEVKKNTSTEDETSDFENEEDVFFQYPNIIPYELTKIAVIDPENTGCAFLGDSVQSPISVYAVIIGDFMIRGYITKESKTCISGSKDEFVHAHVYDLRTLSSSPNAIASNK